MRSTKRLIPALVALSLLATVVLATPAAGAAPAGGKQLRPAPELADELLVRVNGLRATVGSPPLARDRAIDGFAMRWSEAMAQSVGLAHNPDLEQIPGQWIKAGENVGVGTELGPMFDAFVKSAHHYPNLVDPAFTRTGIAVVVDGNGELWVTQDFQQPKDARPAGRDPAARPTAAPAPARRSVPRVARAAPPQPLPPPAPTLPPAFCFALRALGGPSPEF